MKIWPFDGYASRTNGQYISPSDLKKALEPVRKIRQTLGEEMDLAMEFHGCWNLNCAITIAQALEEYEVMWLEEMMPPDNLEAYEHLSRATRLPLTISERLLTRYPDQTLSGLSPCCGNQFLPVMQRGIARVIMPDVEWCGGISEAKKIATMAEAFQLPIAFHNYGGPVLNFASAHVAASLPNLMILETGRNLLANWTEEIITQPVIIEDGHMALPEGPGLGTAFQPEFLRRGDLILGTVS